MIPTRGERDFLKQIKAIRTKQWLIIMKRIFFHFSPQPESGHIEIFGGESFIPAVVYERVLKTGDSNDTQFNGSRMLMEIAI